MEEVLASNLLKLSAIYCESQALNPSTVGRQCAADGRFFLRIRQGKTFTVKKYDDVLLWFSLHWPEDLSWPEEVPRPVADMCREAAE